MYVRLTKLTDIHFFYLFCDHLIKYHQLKIGKLGIELFVWSKNHFFNGHLLSYVIDIMWEFENILNRNCISMHDSNKRKIY